NAYLVYQSWAQAGARLGWNLVQALTGKPRLEMARSREEVVRVRRLVLHMAVVSQTRIAYHEYRAAREQLLRLDAERETRRRLRDHSANRGELGLEAQLDYVHNAAAAALGRVQQCEAQARYQSALGLLYASLGLDPLAGEEATPERTLAQLTRQMRENELQWRRRFFLLPEERNPVVESANLQPLPLEQLAGGTEAVPEPPPSQPESPAAAPAQEAPYRFALQVSAIQNYAKVEPELARLRAKGFQPELHSGLDREGRTSYFVWIGRYRRAAEAVAARDAYRRATGQEAYIKRLD
ncbi:MAG: SPOR domain-containing protein, partial [Magnetococcus sp. YQC-5]